MATPPHIIVFPVPIQGHLNPFNWLADYFVASGLSVTLVHTARSFSILSRNGSFSVASLSSTSNPRIAVVPYGFPHDDHTNIKRGQLLASFPAMEKGFDELMHKLTMENGYPPSCIVTESFLPWTQNVADKHGIARIELWTCSATAYALMMVMPQLAERGYLPFQTGSEMKMIDVIPGMPPFPLGTFPKVFREMDVKSSFYEYFCGMFAHNRKAGRVLVYTFYDLESVVIDALRAQLIPIEPIGPFLLTKGPLSASLRPEDASCLDWLDAQQEFSVLYVAFGSMASLDKETLQELAFGLELSQVHFLWVIRSDAVTGNLSDFLPEDFQSRTQARSRIVSWAPQLAVLAHPAVGAFLTHCGWNSTLESLCMGVPMIGFPDAIEQNTNLKCIIDWKVGLELDQQDGGGARCNRATVEKVVRAMMQGVEGKDSRRQAQEVRKAATRATQDGSSKANLEKLVEDLKKGGKQKAACPPSTLGTY